MLSLCGMKTQQMHTGRTNAPSWALTAVALLGLIGLAHGQGDQLSELTPVPMRSMVAEPRQAIAGPAPYHVPVKITDDGGQGDEHTATAQLVLVFESEGPRSITVEVFDEQGRKVRRSVLTAKPGGNALAVDVANLREGRYVARITEGESGRVVRFHR